MSEITEFLAGWLDVHFDESCECGNGDHCPLCVARLFIDRAPDVLAALAAAEQQRDEAREQLAAADALADWVGWWLSARREEEATKFTEMRKRLDAYRALAPAAVAEGKADDAK